jgi:hypothetical protein
MVKGLDENKHFFNGKQMMEKTVKRNTLDLSCSGCIIYCTFVPNVIISS